MNQTGDNPLAKDHASARPFALISDERLQGLYEAVLQCSLLERFAGQVRAGQVRAGLVHAGQDGSTGGVYSSPGFEATAAGVLLHLRPEDVLSPCCGSLSQRFLKGESLDRLLKPASTSPMPKSTQRRKKMALAGIRSLAIPGAVRIIPPMPSAVSSPALSSAAMVDEQLIMAIGAAFTQIMERKGEVTAVFFGAGQGGSYGWHQDSRLAQIVRFAQTHCLPMLFICQREMIEAGSEAEADQMDADLGDVPCVPVDADDVVAVYRVAQEAISHAREGSGPTLIHAKSDRKPGRSGMIKAGPSGMKKAGRSGMKKPDRSGMSLARRSMATPASQDIPAFNPETEPVTDPILFMEAYLKSRGLYSPQLKRRATAAFRRALTGLAR